ncbi:unnamed protein product [Oppiella nova]|uniref:Uncharacterized protein n=1 Tax=Oppiella nova TaxID=334625 RepID=A0A7R9LRE7_9ACAR|nr:unnamed protein product [Oppiella nova]CAG2166241.1 unnamed protein product [Oppiella nova]
MAAKVKRAMTADKQSVADKTAIGQRASRSCVSRRVSTTTTATPTTRTSMTAKKRPKTVSDVTKWSFAETSALMTDESESEYDIGYEITLTDTESEDSLQEMFNPKTTSVSSSCYPTVSHRSEDIEKPRQQVVIDGMESLKRELTDTADEIIGGPKRLKESIVAFNKELSRLTDQLRDKSVSDIDIHIKYQRFMANSSEQLPQSSTSPPKRLKIFMPNINKKL